MAHIWVWDEAGTWSVITLSGISLDVGRFPPSAVPDLQSASANGAGVLLLPTVPSPAGGETPGPGVSDDAIWSLMWPEATRVQVNGLPLFTGFRVLRHQDEIRIASRTPMFFSTERLARTETLTSTDRELVCPRDKRPVQVGESVVICPSCRVIHHQTGEFNCWTYSPTCAMCDFPTDLNAGFRWIPDDL